MGGTPFSSMSRSRARAWGCSMRCLRVRRSEGTLRFMLAAMKLHNYFRSSASFRVRIALELKGLAYDYLPVHLVKGEHKQAEYAARSPPPRLVPTLETDDGAPGRSRWRSSSTWTRRIPSRRCCRRRAGPRARARAGAADRLRDPPAEQPARAQVPGARTEGGGRGQERWYRHWVRDGLEAFERELARLARRHLLPRRHADAGRLLLVPQIFNGAALQRRLLRPVPTRWRVRRLHEASRLPEGAAFGLPGQRG